LGQPAPEKNLRKMLGRLTHQVGRLRRFILLGGLFVARKLSRFFRSPEAAGRFRKKVDVVYLWKDESDGNWVKRERSDLDSLEDSYYVNQPQYYSDDAKLTLDDLRYSLRSVEKYFADLGHVYIVTDGQRPRWLNPECKDITIVDTTEIFDDEAYLPSYNSQAIESYLYNIEELTDEFIYLNDDFYFNSPMNSSDFFLSDGRIRVRLGRGLSSKGEPCNNEDADTSAHKNSNAVLDTRFKNEIRMTVMHRPYSLSKPLMRECLKRFPEEFHQTRKSRFRSITMYALHNCLIPYACYYGGKAQLIPPSIFEKDMYVWTNDLEENESHAKELLKRRHEGFCVQEDRALDLTQESVRQFHELMNNLYPEKSRFEI
jgi:hypothetical protein